MKVIIAPDSFKGSLTAIEASEAIAKGVKHASPSAETVLIPMADGGEGTVSALVRARHGQTRLCVAHNPYGEEITAAYGVIEKGRVAVIEVAAASGIQYQQPGRDLRLASSFGTGELIKDALDHGVRQIIIGLGGSGTNDGGAGLLQALGVQFLDAKGSILQKGGAALQDLEKIDISKLDSRLSQSSILIASDVTNPLTGPNGATAIFGPQKGATPEMVEILDHALVQYSKIIAETTGIEVAVVPGAGAAGGCAAGLLAFTPTTIQPGVTLILNESRFDKLSQGADIVITGEGAIDFQTRFGKTPYGVAKSAKQLSSQPIVIGLAGKIGANLADLYLPSGPFDVIMSISSGARTLDEAIVATASDLETTSYNMMRMYLAAVKN